MNSALILLLLPCSYKGRAPIIIDCWQPQQLTVEAYVDASYATAKNRKSITGAVVLVGGAVVGLNPVQSEIVRFSYQHTRT